MIHPNIKAIHLTVPDCPTFQVLWNWQGVDCYFNRFTIKNVKGELRLPKGKRFKSKHSLLNNLKRLLIAFKVRSGLESN